MPENSANTQICVVKSLFMFFISASIIYFRNILTAPSSKMTFCDGCIILGNRNHIYWR